VFFALGFIARLQRWRSTSCGTLCGAYADAFPPLTVLAEAPGLPKLAAGVSGGMSC
jgi:hypothetical protein